MKKGLNTAELKLRLLSAEEVRGNSLCYIRLIGSGGVRGREVQLVMSVMLVSSALIGNEDFMTSHCSHLPLATCQ